MHHDSRYRIWKWKPGKKKLQTHSTNFLSFSSTFCQLHFALSFLSKKKNPRSIFPSPIFFSCKLLLAPLFIVQQVSIPTTTMVMVTSLITRLMHATSWKLGHFKWISSAPLWGDMKYLFVLLIKAIIINTGIGLQKEGVYKMINIYSCICKLTWSYNIYTNF